MINILIVVDVQDNCGFNFYEHEDFIKNIEDNIKTNELIILTQNSNPLHHNAKMIENYPTNCNNSNNCTTTSTARYTKDTVISRAINKVVTFVTPQSKLFIYDDFKNEILKLNSDEELKHTISLNKSFIEDQYSIKIGNINVNSVEPVLMTYDDSIKSFIKLNKNENCFFKSYSAFNYHLKLGSDTFGLVDNPFKYNYRLDKTENYSTGLYEYIIKYITSKNLNINDTIDDTINYTINITVCGMDTIHFSEIYTIIFGIVCKNTMYNDELSKYTVNFILDESHITFTKDYAKNLYNIITRLINESFDTSILKKIEIKFIIKNKEIRYTYFYYVDKNSDRYDDTDFITEDHTIYPETINLKDYGDGVIYPATTSGDNSIMHNASIAYKKKNFDKYIKYKSKYLSNRKL